MRTVGIDLSANPAKTAACEIDWMAGTVVLLDRPVTDQAVVAAVSRAGMSGVDVPLGWPDGFVSAVAAHHRGAGWPPVAEEPPLDRVRLRFRRTDLAVMEASAQPLSVSTDRIGVAAMRGARLQELLARAGIAVDRSGITGRLAEVYPAAALRSWGLPSSGYKGTRKRAACRTLAGQVAARCGPLSKAVAGCLDDADDDDLDGVVCALMARAVSLGLTRCPGPGELDVARREGWIHVPTAPLEVIAERRVIRGA